jgi:Flp pilus assembly protein TadG
MVSVDCGTRGAYRRGRPEQGSAVVEFSISVTLLLVLLFGIITYGYVLSFKQAMTQAAAEGARAGAVGSDVSAAVTRSVGAFNKTCGSGGLTCTFTTTSCSGHTCQQVQLTYDYAHYPLLPKFPGLGLLLPGTLTSTSIAEVN